jgi:hypothetical protein
MRVEPHSLRAVERLRQHPHNAILHWIDLAGQHAATVSAALVCNLHITQAQVDELWTFVKKRQEHLQPDDPIDAGDMWIQRAIALPSRLRVVSHISHERIEEEASTFLADFKARTDGCAPLFTSDKLPAYLEALIANYSTPEPPPVKRGPG